MAASHVQYVRSEPHVLAMWQTCTYFYPRCRFIVPLSPLFPPLSFGSLFSPSPPDRLSPLSLPLPSLRVCTHPCSVAELGGRLPDDLASGPTNPPFTQLGPVAAVPPDRCRFATSVDSDRPFSESQATVKLSCTAPIFNRASWGVEARPARLEFQNISAARREALPQQILINSTADNVTFSPVHHSPYCSLGRHLHPCHYSPAVASPQRAAASFPTASHTPKSFVSLPPRLPANHTDAEASMDALRGEEKRGGRLVLTVVAGRRGFSLPAEGAGREP